MFRRVAAFEIRYLLSNPLLWLTAAAVFLMPFAALAFGFNFEEDVRVYKNSAYEVISKYRLISCLFMFATTIFVSNIVLRDDETGFAPILRSTGIGRFDYLIGRFAGAFVLMALCLALVSPAIWLGSLMPGADPALVGPNRPGDHFFAYALIALPNILVTASIFFALATVSRSMMATYIGLIVFLGAYFSLMSAYGGQADLVDAVAILDPFAGRAFEDAVRYWTPPERNSLLPPLEGNLLVNRLLWLAVSAGALALAYARFDFAAVEGRRGAARRAEGPPAEDSGPAPAEARAGRLPAPGRGREADRALLGLRTRFEVRQVLGSPAFIVLMLYSAFLTGFVLISDRDPDDSPTWPFTAALIPELREIFFLIPLVIVIVYSGEMVWRERDRRMHEIVDAAPHPNWAYVVPKALALGLVLLGVFLASVAASVAIQLAAGYDRIDPGAYLLHYVLPMTWDAMLAAALAILVQVLSPHKYVGWGIMTLYVAAKFTGIMPEHNLLNYAGVPPTALSDMDGPTSFWANAWLFRLYWGALALLLLVAAHLLWRRGTETRLKPRAALALRRLSGPAGRIAGGAALAFAATGAFAFYSVNLVNRYEPARAAKDRQAAYERDYRRFATLDQPAIAHMEVAIDLYPERRLARASGRYVLRNRSARPIADVHVRIDDRDLKPLRIAIAGARLAVDDRRYDHRIYRLDRPMAPGETRTMDFAAERRHSGFVNGAPEVGIAGNGTFLTAKDLLPAVGVHTQPLIQDEGVRARFGLPSARRARLEDLSATAYPSDGLSWSTSDIKVSTSAGQVPVAPGRRVADSVSGGRRTARFVSDSPIRTAFGILSARYAVRRASAGGIDYEVYHHPGHGWNVGRMLAAMRMSLDYYRANFGPYQFRDARIVEFPSYGRTFAQAFAGTIPSSEETGFNADLRAPGAIDGITPLMAHEMAHQYWGHQLSPAAVEGSLVLTETLAQYSALMVIRRSLGEDMLRRKLREQLDNYLAFRAWSKQKEAPLARAESQDYLYYYKGALVMAHLARRLGEDRVNRALRSLLARYRFKGAPYPRSADLFAALRAEARTAEDQALITDLFERIALYDLRAGPTTATRRADGKWLVRVPVTARKLYADRGGAEREARLDERIEMGLFAAKPGSGALAERDVILLRRARIVSGRQVLSFVVDRRPAFAGVDPFGFYVDRNGGDNVAEVGG